MLAVFLVVACGDEDKKKGGSASKTDYSCSENNITFTGTNGKVVSEPCTKVCEELSLGYTGICDFDQERGHEFCFCEEICCDNDDTRCAGDDMEVCRACEWTTISCDAYCSNFDTTSLGCGVNSSSGSEGCLCEGMFQGCLPGHTKCTEGYVNICSPDGSWSAESCRSECEKEGYHFSYCEVDMSGPKEVCHCAGKPESPLCSESSPQCHENSISVCKDGQTKLVECSVLCEDLGLSYISCGNDPDRDHDACFCGE